MVYNAKGTACTVIVFHNTAIVTADIAVVTQCVGNVTAYTVKVFKNNGIVTAYIGSVTNET